MAGFIVLEDGRAYAAGSRATDAVIRAVAREVDDPPLRDWLLEQQSDRVGMGMTCVDLRDLAPHYRPVLRGAIRQAYAHVQQQGAFEQLDQGDADWEEWLARFGDLIEMLRRSEAGEPPTEFNPHMRDLIPERGLRAGPGWDS
jgi:hypothetical protein